MTIQELVEKMKMTERERCGQNKEYNGIFSIIDHWYKGLHESLREKEIAHNRNCIYGTICGLQGAHFINEAEAEQLIKELDDIYDMRMDELRQ